MKIVLAQGNPGDTYKGSRHNLGFDIIDQFAAASKLKWTAKTKFSALIAETSIGDEIVLLAKPTTFYNETGQSARSLVDFYKLNPRQDLLVVHDDLALPLGTIRTRASGSDAGNNGIRSLNSHLGDAYHRIRLGVWSEMRDKMDDTDFVLGRFNKAEQAIIKDTVAPKALELIEQFIAGNMPVSTHK